MTGGCGIALKHQTGFDLKCFALLRYVYPWHCVATSVLPFASSLCSAYFCFVLCSALLWPALRSFGFRCFASCFALLAFLLLCAKCFRLVRHMLLCLFALHSMLCFGGFARQVPGKPPGLCRKPSVIEKPCVFKERR